MAQQGLERFLRSFGADALDLLPDELWDRLLLIRSAPGGGKTSLLRALTAETVWALRNEPPHEEIRERLRQMGVLDEEFRPQVLGFKVPLTRDFQAIVDLESEPASARRTFQRLLDARVVASFCEAVGHLATDENGDFLSEVELVPDTPGNTSVDRIGGTNCADQAAWARRTENELLDRLDAVLPRDEPADGHAAFYSFRALSGAKLRVQGEVHDLRFLLLFDDGHDLDPGQRALLLDALHDRELSLARWYTERFSAMESEEVVGDGEPWRNNTLVELEREAGRMGNTTRRGGRTRRFEKLLADIASRRARRGLSDYADEDREFVELLDVAASSEVDNRAEKAAQEIQSRIYEAARDFPDRYRKWFEDADELTGTDRATRWRELEIIVSRDLSRPELGLFEVELTDEERKARSGSSIREAADLFLRREFGLPFYYGSTKLSTLSAENIEQYLNICAGLFDEMLVGVTLRQGATLDHATQDAAINIASERFWSDIPARRRGGRGIQQLLRHIARMCRNETYRPNAPYAPGVTGTALSMDDRVRLLDPEIRSRIPGAERLFEALGGAIGHNLLRADLNRSVKNNRWMVLYLNRLTCVRYGLPLGYGGFREKPLEEMCRWMLDDIEDVTEPSTQETLDFS